MAYAPEVQQILDQAGHEIEAARLAGEVATITIHCGHGDMSVEVVRKRKHEPVRFENKRLTVVGRAR